MPEPTDLILLEPGDDGWTYRYEAYEPGSVPFARDLYGRTFCCDRPIATPSGLRHIVRDFGSGVGFPGFPVIDDCCDRPFAVHGHKPVELPPYSGEHATCRKCGSKAVETKFTTQAQQRYGIPRAGYPDEWLHRCCVVCRAEWDEATVAAEAGAAPPSNLTPHEAAPWSVWTIGSRWFVFHSASGHFLPVNRHSLEIATPDEMAEDGARLLSAGGVVDG